MKLGYARTSTFDQDAGLEAQQRDLKKAGCSRIFHEQVSSIAKRDQLEAALDHLRKGDTLVVTKLDRLARSMADFVRINAAIEAKGARLNVLNLGMDTGTATGKLTLGVLVSVAEFERSMMLERQREGIAKAKVAGKYKGRKPTARAKAKEAKALRRQGVGPTEIAKRLGIGRASVYRILAT